MGVSECGLSPEESGSLTLKELDSLMGIVRDKVKRESHLTGLVCATIYNSVRRKRSDKIWKPTDFFGKERKMQTPEQMKSIASMIHSFFKRSK